MKMILCLVLLSTTAFAADRSVTAAGRCLKSITPDRGAISLTAEVTKKNVKDASNEAAKIYKSVLNEVKKLNLKDQEIQTTETSLAEDITWENNKRKSNGFKSRMGFQVTSSEIFRLGEVLSIASEAGLKDMGGLSQFVSAVKLKSEKEACLEEAVQNAKAKASRMAKAAGSDIGAVLKIEEGEGRSSNPAPMRTFIAADAKSFDNVAIESKQETISVDVFVQFALK